MKYRFTYSQTDTYSATFTANSLEEAKALLDQAIADNGNIGDLPDFDSVGVGFDEIIDLGTLEEN